MSHYFTPDTEQGQPLTEYITIPIDLDRNNLPLKHNLAPFTQQQYDNGNLIYSKILLSRAWTHPNGQPRLTLKDWIIKNGASLKSYNDFWQYEKSSAMNAYRDINSNRLRNVLNQAHSFVSEGRQPNLAHYLPLTETETTQYIELLEYMRILSLNRLIDAYNATGYIRFPISHYNGGAGPSRELPGEFTPLVATPAILSTPRYLMRPTLIEGTRAEDFRRIVRKLEGNSAWHHPNGEPRMNLVQWLIRYGTTEGTVSQYFKYAIQNAINAYNQSNTGVISQYITAYFSHPDDIRHQYRHISGAELTRYIGVIRQLWVTTLWELAVPNDPAIGGPVVGARGVSTV